MIVHRLLDAFFRTLDAIDAVRDRVDQALGREPRPDPWAVEWPPPGESGPFDDEPARAAPAEAAPPRPPPGPDKARDEVPRAAPAQARTAGAAKTATSKAAAPKAAKGDPAVAAAMKKPGPKKKSASKRKGSVDRSGKDLDSPRARAVVARLRDRGDKVVDEEAELDGKKVLARVVWALAAAEGAGSEKGLTTNDVSALLSLAAGIEVFATNIGRACRDHKELIEESEPDGRSKRYVLTPAGHKAAAALGTRPVQA